MSWRLFAIMLACAFGARAEPVHFADPQLEEAVRDAFVALGRPLGETIDDLDLVGVGFTRLDASRRCIGSIEGIQHCLDLNFLELSYNEIADISALANLTRLECLFLGIYDFEATPVQALPEPAFEYHRNNRITDIWPLAGLHNLNYVDLAGNNDLVDMRPLTHLPQLEWLVLGRNSITDYSFLSGLPRLANFANFYGNMTDDDLARLAEKRGMLRLGIGFNKITTLAPLANYANIYALLAQGNAIHDISALEKLPRLEYIFLQSNQITDLGPLARNPAVAYRDFFNLGNNPISVASACQDLPVIRARFDKHGKFGCDAVCGDAVPLTITVRGEGTTAPLPGTRSYVENAQLNIIASPLPGSGFAFERWSVDTAEAESPSLGVTMTRAQTLEAVFVPRSDHALTVNVAGGGSGTVLPGVGAPFAYLHGRVALLSATPVDGQYFVGWSGDVQSVEPTVPLVMDRDKVVTARFTIHPQTLTIAATDGGATVPGAGSHVFGRGRAVQLRARPATGFGFSHWKGNLDPKLATSAALRITLDQDLSLTPVFVTR